MSDQETNKQTSNIDWYFDLVSPFAYLQLHSLKRLPSGFSLTPKPVLLGAILKHWGQIGPAEIVPKRLHTYRMALWTAESRGIPYRMPARHPFNPLKALRLLATLDLDVALVRRAFDFVFKEGNVPERDEELQAFATYIRFTGDPVARAGEQSAKDALRRNTEEAIGRGAFGVPTSSVGGELFWGDDATGMLLAYLDDPAFFTKGEMARLADVPVGVVREAVKARF